MVASTRSVKTMRIDRYNGGSTEYFGSRPVFFFLWRFPPALPALVLVEPARRLSGGFRVGALANSHDVLCGV